MRSRKRFMFSMDSWYFSSAISSSISFLVRGRGRGGGVRV
jgi:hypothetical protein